MISAAVTTAGPFTSISIVLSSPEYNLRASFLIFKMIDVTSSTTPSTEKIHVIHHQFE